MIKTTKYIFAGIGALVLLVALVLAAFIASFDANRYKSELAARAEAATGRKLEIGGDINVSFFPWLAIEASDLRLANRAGFGDAPMITVGKASVRVKLMPLFSRRIEVGKIRVEGLALVLQRSADGRDNWSDIVSHRAETAEAAVPATDDASVDLSVEGIVIQDGAFTLDDAQAGSKLVVEQLDLVTSPLVPDRPLDFKGSSHVKSDQPAIVASIDISGHAAAAFDAVTDVALRIDAEGAALPAPIKDGKLHIAKLSLGEPLQVEGMALELWGVKLEGSATRSGDELKAKVTSAQFVPRVLMKTLGIEVPVTADATVLGSARLAFDLTTRGDMLRINGLALTLDQTKLSGHVAVDSIERHAARFDFALDAIDLDRYLPPVTQKADLKLGGFEGVKVPTELLRGLDLAGELRAGKLSVAKADATDLKLDLTARHGALEVRSMSAKVYGGRVTANGALDGRPAVPTAAFKLDLKDFNVGEFMQDVVGKTYATGIAALSFDLAGDGATLGAIKHDLDGPLRFDISHGTLEGFNVWKEARIAYATYKKRETTAKADPDRTEFEKLTGGADLKAGVATLVGTTAAIPYAAVTATGTIDLKANRLNLVASAKITGAPVFGPKEDYSDLKGTTLPVKINGPFVDPSVSVDVLKALMSTLKPDKLLKDEKLKKKLKSIFG